MRLTKKEFVDALTTYEKMFKQNNKIADAMNEQTIYSDVFVNNYYDMIIKMCDIPDDNFNSSFGCDIDVFAHELDFGKRLEQFCISRQVDSAHMEAFKSAEALYDKLVAEEQQK